MRHFISSAENTHTHTHVFENSIEHRIRINFSECVSAYAWSIKHEHDYAVFSLFISVFIAVFLSLTLPSLCVDVVGFYLESISKNVQASKKQTDSLYCLVYSTSHSNGYTRTATTQKHEHTQTWVEFFSKKKKLRTSKREKIEMISKKFWNLLFLTKRRFFTLFSLVSIRILFTSYGSFHFGERLLLIIICLKAIVIWLYKMTTAIIWKSHRNSK